MREEGFRGLEIWTETLGPDERCTLIQHPSAFTKRNSLQRTSADGKGVDRVDPRGSRKVRKSTRRQHAGASKVFAELRGQERLQSCQNKILFISTQGSMLNNLRG